MVSAIGIAKKIVRLIPTVQIIIYYSLACSDWQYQIAQPYLGVDFILHAVGKD